LTSDVSVTDTDNQTILGSIVLILVLEYQALASLVICFALLTPLEFNLVALEVLLVFNNFNESLKLKEKFFD
jgi:hypothetical protein